ncbi:MAG: prephenate dehydrogenase/arogenate dehydrogenase family protein [Clostridia bacterium]|nr:prephenate dehydrogenase/arogenate dehydrogenase family protein [Clostridia bacterium]
MKTGIVGLGLIGGSMAKAYKKSGQTVYGADANEITLGYALLSGIADDKLTDENLGTCDLILLAVNPDIACQWLRDNASKIARETMVIDLCGTKRQICETGFALAEEYGFTFVGGHPMAGLHLSGIKNSKEDMFAGAPMVIVPPNFDDIALYDKIECLLVPAHFGKFTFTTAEEHDRVIAYTSQMAHVVSNAYVKSPVAQEKNHVGISAGSYKDLTRVAWLNETMWTELFMENRDNLINEIDQLVGCLNAYKSAMENEDRETLLNLLREGRLAKESADGTPT